MEKLSNYKPKIKVSFDYKPLSDYTHDYQSNRSISNIGFSLENGMNDYNNSLYGKSALHEDEYYDNLSMYGNHSFIKHSLTLLNQTNTYLNLISEKMSDNIRSKPSFYKNSYKRISKNGKVRKYLRGL